MTKTSKRILFIDDDEGLVQLSADLLTDLGFQVDCALSGKEALKLFQQQNGDYDLLITDETMPEMSGIELAQEVYRQSPATPVLLCTGHMLTLQEPGIDRTNIMAVIAKTEICTRLPDILEELL
jgi:CheY-like chemotaxis protein